MKRSLVFALGLAALVLAVVVQAQGKRPESFDKGLELVHAFSGAGNELDQAAEIARALAKSHADGGYSQTLTAEILSTWSLSQHGKPDDVFRQIMALTDEALRLNPSLAEAHVARARALLRAGKEEEAKAAIDAALTLDPKLTGAFFLRAEVFRRRLLLAEAETWYLKFIAATPSAARRSNAYHWMAFMYETAAWKEPRQWTAHITKARGAYEKGIELDPRAAWKLVNFATFLNEKAEDFPAAEKYARGALDVMDFPAARYQLAFARYQALQAEPKMSDAALKKACEDISQATGVSLDEAIGQASRWVAIAGRLEMVRARLAPRGTGGKATWR